MKKTKLETDLFYYGNYLELISSFSLSKQLTLKDLGDDESDKAVIQKCYRDMRREKFKGTVIDYLCWISAQYIFNLWLKEDDASEDKNSFFYRARILIKDLGIKLHGVKRESKSVKETITVISIGFLILCNTYKAHSRNILRLFHNNPDLIIKKSMGYNYHLSPIRTILNMFNLMNILSCYEFLREQMTVQDKNLDDRLWNYILPYAVEALIMRKIDLGKYQSIEDIKFNNFIDG